MRQNTTKVPIATDLGLEHLCKTGPPASFRYLATAESRGGAWNQSASGYTTALVVIFLILAIAGIVVILVMMVTSTNGMVVRFHAKGSNGIKNEQYHGSRHDITAK